MSSIEEVRKKIQPEFKSKEEFYKYRWENGSRSSREELYKEASDSLLPIFKAAKEMCEHISGDKDYFKKNDWEQGYPLTRLYHMAIVSKVIQDINENCVTTEDKEECIQLFTQDYAASRFTYLKNGEFSKTTPLFKHEKISCFMGISNFSFDDQYYHKYMGAIQEDIKPTYYRNEKPRSSVNGNILSWDNMKNSKVLYAIAYHFVVEEGWKLQKESEQSETAVKLSEQEKKEKHFKIFRQAENNIKAKINEFCDMKQTQFMKQMQKSNTEVKE